MRKFWLVIPLVLVAAVWLYGCDESPVAPDSAVAATQQSAQDGATFAKKPPEPVPPTTGLVGVQMVYTFASREGPGQWSAEAWCPEGKVPITGGVSSEDVGAQILASRPAMGLGLGWMGAVRWDTTIMSTKYMQVFVVCADGVWEDPKVIESD